jgi:hypothetical protein
VLNKLINHEPIGRSEFHALVYLIKSILVLHSNFEVKFVKRQANMVAHTLARVACSWASHRIFEICPPYIDSTLNNDMNYVCFGKYKKKKKTMNPRY